MDGIQSYGKRHRAGDDFGSAKRLKSESSSVSLSETEEEEAKRIAAIAARAEARLREKNVAPSMKEKPKFLSKVRLVFVTVFTAEESI
jgi:hypothetical protein